MYVLTCRTFVDNICAIVLNFSTREIREISLSMVALLLLA